jgi:murein DD-endopeptidase MepM/ murein hydrolase activator NlpD
MPTRNLSKLQSIGRKAALFLFLLAACFAGLGNTLVLALSQTDLDAIYKDTVWYKNETGVFESCTAGQEGGGGSGGGGVNDGNPYHTMLYPPIADEQKAIGAINKYIEDHYPSSPYRGMGDAFITGGKRGNVNPFLAVAILVKESSMATASGGWHDPNSTGGTPSYNGFGRSATSSQPHVTYNGTDNFGNPKTWLVYKWDSWRNSLDDGASGDDWFHYFRAVYLVDLNIAPNDFNRLVEAYLGASTKEQHDQYTAQILGYIDDVVKLLDDPNIGDYVNNSGTGDILCDTAPPVTSGSYIWPIDKAGFQSLTTCWNTPRDLNGSSYRHGGLDIAAARGTNIYASASGTVEIASFQDGHGLSIVINHKNGYWTVYKHQQTVLVNVGQNVQQGQVIGKVDSTGTSTGDHLHFNVQNVGGIIGSAGNGNLNPLDYLPNDGRSYNTGNPAIGSCIPGPRGQTGGGGQDIST